MAYRRRAKKTTGHGGRLMIVLRNRHTIWVDADPTKGPKMREDIMTAMSNNKTATVTIGEDTIRVEDIVHVKYQPPKAEPPKAEPPTEEKA